METKSGEKRALVDERNVTSKRSKDTHSVISEVKMITPPPMKAFRSLLPHMTMTEDKTKTKCKNSTLETLDFSHCVVPLRTRRQHKVILGQEEESTATICESEETVKTEVHLNFDAEKVDIPDHEIYRIVDLDEPLSSLAISAQKCEELFEMYGKKMFKKDELVYIPNESLGHTVQQSCEKLRKHLAAALDLPLERIGEVNAVMSKGTKPCPCHFDTDPLSIPSESDKYAFALYNPNPDFLYTIAAFPEAKAKAFYSKKRNFLELASELVDYDPSLEMELLGRRVSVTSTPKSIIVMTNVAHRGPTGDPNRIFIRYHCFIYPETGPRMRRNVTFFGCVPYQKGTTPEK